MFIYHEFDNLNIADAIGMLNMYLMNFSRQYEARSYGYIITGHML